MFRPPNRATVNRDAGETFEFVVQVVAEQTAEIGDMRPVVERELFVAPGAQRRRVPHIEPGREMTAAKDVGTMNFETFAVRAP